MRNHLIVTCNNVTNHGWLAEGQGAVRPPPTVMVSVGLRTWIALYPFLPAQTPFLYINVVLKRRKPMRILLLIRLYIILGIKEEVEQTFGTLVSMGNIYQKNEVYLNLR